MTRSLIVLVLASFSLVAGAADKPQPVTVQNPVLPVEISNADPIPVTVTPAEGELVSCANPSVGGVGHTSGRVGVDTGSVTGAFDVSAPAGSFSCSESLPDGMSVEEITVRFNHTQNVTYARAYVTIGDPGDSTPLVLGVISSESPRVKLIRPLRLTGGKLIKFSFDCGTPLTEEVTCSAGFTLLGTKL